MTSLSDLEQFVARRGFRVFPVFGIRDGACLCSRGDDCDAPGKHPMTRHGVKDATKDPLQIVRWFNYRPGCNWAVATGARSGVWVLDLDVREHDGVESMRRWAEGMQVTLPETYAVQSGSGGWHFYFANAGVKKQIGVLDGVDIAGDGGYVLLPGSNHVSGGTYRVARDAPFALAPDALVDLANGPGLSNRSGGGRRRRKERTGQSLDYYLEHGFTPGNRDNECYDLACALWRMHWDEPMLVEALIGECWYLTPDHDSFPWSQALKKIRGAREFIQSQRTAEAKFLRQIVGAA